MREKISNKNSIVRETHIKRPGTKRQILNAFFFIGIIIIIGIVAYFIFLPKKQTYTLKSYRYAMVKRGNVTNSIQASGKLVILNKKTVLAPESGIIKTIEVSEGDSVKRNQRLATIYSQELEENLNEAVTNLTKKTRSKNNQILQHKYKEIQYMRYLKKLKRREAIALKNYQKYKSLYKTGAATEKELETALNTYRSAQEAISDYKINSEENFSYYKLTIKNLDTDINTLEKKISYIQEQIKHCRILSPITGEVIEIYETPGNYISRFSKIMIIANLSDPIVELKISENEIHNIKKNQKVIITMGTQKSEGYVYKIGLKAIENSGNYGSSIIAEVHFRKIPDRVIPGTNVSAIILTGIKKNILYLPRGSYLITGSEHYVYKIKNDKAYKKEVNFGTITDTKVEILGGLKENDMIITSGYQDFINFDQINLDVKGGEKID